MYIPETSHNRLEFYLQILILLILWDSRHLQLKHYRKTGELYQAIQYSKQLNSTKKWLCLTMTVTYYVHINYYFFYLIFFITICKTTYKDIQYTTLLILLALLTRTSFAHTQRKKKEEETNKRKGKGRTTYYICASVTYKNKIKITKILVLVALLTFKPLK